MGPHILIVILVEIRGGLFVPQVPTKNPHLTLKQQLWIVACNLGRYLCVGRILCEIAPNLSAQSCGLIRCRV